eukprot:NODE_116_length_18347_cov_2.280962.p8 type:complete len:289 gc:universal NODE_116_length_18347_cov_2.280962:17433-16567(-)
MSYERYDTMLLVKKEYPNPEELAKKLKCTHVAYIDKILNDTLRTPQLKPLMGNFDQYWAKAKQFGIFYSWYPLKTMFSKGNHFEKQVIGQKKANLVVDLCAGIGYWCFPLYSQGKCVIACEWNPFSIAGMIIGANLNKQRIVVLYKKDTFTVDGKNIYGEIESIAELMDIKTKVYWKFGVDKIENLNNYINQKVIVVCPGNHHEYERYLSGLNADLVLCGLLPTSKGMWNLAKKIVFGSGEMIIHECSTSEEELYTKLDSDMQPKSARKVKNYAPNVYHYVVECTKSQ